MLLLRFSALDWILSVCGRANKGDDDAAAAHPQMLFAPDDLFVVTDNHFSLCGGPVIAALLCSVRGA